MPEVTVATSVHVAAPCGPCSRLSSRTTCTSRGRPCRRQSAVAVKALSGRRLALRHRAHTAATPTPLRLHHRRCRISENPVLPLRMQSPLAGRRTVHNGVGAHAPYRHSIRQVPPPHRAAGRRRRCRRHGHRVLGAAHKRWPHVGPGYRSFAGSLAAGRRGVGRHVWRAGAWRSTRPRCRLVVVIGSSAATTPAASCAV